MCRFFFKDGLFGLISWIFYNLVLFTLGLVSRECVNEESELENCECGWLLLFKVFSLSFFSLILFLLTLFAPKQFEGGPHFCVALGAL